MKKSKVLLPTALLLGTLVFTGCVPYDEPEFVEIAPNETAFVVPLEGATSDQGKFESESFLQDLQVATKRVNVPHKKVKMGRGWWNVKYLDTVRVITVDRTPTNRQWLNDSSRSSDGKSSGFVGESNDSVKFKVGISLTAKIEEESTAKFLYNYSSKKSLSDVMDTQIRNKVGTVLLEEYGTMGMASIRTSKSEVMDHVRGEVIPYFKDRGITIDSLGYVGDLEYVDPAVQTAINEAFNAEQQQQAQEIKNETEIQKAQAEKEASLLRKEAMKEISQMRELDIEEAWIEAWKKGGSQVPEFISGGGTESFMFNTDKSKKDSE